MSLTRHMGVFQLFSSRASAAPAEVGPTVDGQAAGGAGRDRWSDRVFYWLLFAGALATHAYFATVNFKWGFMPGHEFRQTQTALITRYIDEQNNFKPLYEMPLFGKPWVVPLEFPFYEWCVVWLGRATHWTSVVAARTLSLASFYLTLPALYLLLGRAGLARTRRLVVLALVLVTPVHLFYARAFLIDPMAVMFSAWFLALLVETMHRRRLALLAACTVAGTVAGLIKSLVFFAWVFPAGVYGAWLLWRQVRAEAGRAAITRTLAWGLGTMVLPTIALGWWVRSTDALKAVHPSAYFFTSRSLSHDNYGTFSLASRFSATNWRDLLVCWGQAIAVPWAVLGLVAIGVAFLPRERARVLGAFGLFLFPQLLIPYAYGGQDYYFYTCAVFVVVAFGFVANGVLDLPWPRPLRWALVLLPAAAMLTAYQRTYFRWQAVQSHGGSQLAFALRDLLPKKSVIIVAGMDWAAMVPYYSEHKALMIRNGLEWDRTHLERTFASLADEDVGALVLVGEQRVNQDLVRRAARDFNIDTQIAFSDENTDVYLNRFYAHEVLTSGLPPNNPYGLKRGPDRPDDAAKAGALLRPGRGTMAAAFPMIEPVPEAFQARFGYTVWKGGDGPRLNAHPDLDLWVPVPAGATTIEWEYGILQEAWQRSDGGGTNGVEFIADLENEAGQSRQVWTRLLNPRDVEADRGPQRSIISFQARPGEKLVFRTRPHRNDYAFDWAYWKTIRVK